MAVTNPAPPGDWVAAHRPWRRLLAPGVVVIALFPVAVLVVLITLIISPPAALALAIPMSILFGAMWWLGRWVPEPRDARWFAFAWGAVVATTFAGFTNTTVAVGGGEVLAMVVSAPLSEEIAKAAVLWILWRRGFISHPMAGVVYAIWVAAGFAVVEDALYFAGAASEGLGDLVMVVLMRGVLLPFTHPMFTVWVGMAVGYVALCRPPKLKATAIVAAGLIISIVLHAGWNGGIYAAITNPGVLVFVIAAFLVTFAATVVAVMATRRSHERFMHQITPMALTYCTLSAAEMAVFSSSRTYRSARQQLGWRRRSNLDELWWSLRTLAIGMHQHPRTEHEAKADHRRRVVLTSRIAELRSKLLTH